MSIKVATITAPAYWASYLVNGDSSGLDDHEEALADDWARNQEPWYVVGVTDDEPRFTWCYALHGGDVLDYILHRTK
jgi:hypothetical protein